MSTELIRRLETDIEPGDHPYLQGAWTPLLEEVNATDMPVLSGKIPDDIDGIYLRNTQNPVYRSIGRYHPFDGDGMVHMISFKNGEASYRNRFVQTGGRQTALGWSDGKPGAVSPTWLGRTWLNQGRLQHRCGGACRARIHVLLPMR